MQRRRCRDTCTVQVTDRRERPMPESNPPGRDAAPAAPIGTAEPGAAYRDSAMSGDRGTEAAAIPSPARPRARSRTRTWILGLIVVAIAAGVLYTVRYFGYAGGHPTTDDAYLQGDTTII